MAKPTVSQRRRAVRRMSVVGLITFVLLNGIVPAAQAATHKYANGITTLENHRRTSGVRPTIGGGIAHVQLGIGEVSIATYYDYPGFQILRRATSDAGVGADMDHQTYTSARSQCYWSTGLSGGLAKLDCWVKS